MSLSRKKFEKAGGAFSVEGEHRPSDPDIPVWEGNLTVKDTTVTLAGTSEDEILAQAERVLEASAPERLR